MRPVDPLAPTCLWKEARTVRSSERDGCIICAFSREETGIVMASSWRDMTRAAGGAAIADQWSKQEADGNVETKTFYTDRQGEYTPARQKLHNELVALFLEGHSSRAAPHLTLTSGGTASGKSDAAAEAKKLMPDAVYANTDEIRAMLPEFEVVEGTDKAGLLQEEAGDIRDQLLAEAVASAMDIVWDSPGNPSVAEYLSEIETYGYSVTIAYTHRGVQEAKEAAAYRAKNASNPADRRVVPDSVIENSHKKARAGFEAMAGALRREIVVYDKSGKARGEAADIIYRRRPPGRVLVQESERLKAFCESGDPRINWDVF